MYNVFKTFEKKELFSEKHLLDYPERVQIIKSRFGQEDHLII